MLSLNGLDDVVDGVGIDQTNQVETEAVDVVLVSPVVDRVNNVLADHATLGSGIVTTAGAVGVGTGEVIRHSVVHAELGAVVNVVVNDVHDDADAVVMQGLNHLLELLNTDLAVVRIGGVGTLGNVVVHGIVAPVETGVLGLVHTTKVINRQQVDVSDAQVLDVVQTGSLTVGVGGASLSQAQVLAAPLFLNAGGGVDGQVTDVQLPDHGVGDGVVIVGILVVSPAIGVGGGQVDDHGAAAVDAGGTGVGIDTFLLLGNVINPVGVVSAVHVAFQLHGPDTLVATGHFDFLIGILLLSGIAVLEQTDGNALSQRSPNLQSGLFLGVSSAQIVTVIGVLLFELLGGVVVGQLNSILIVFEGDVVGAIQSQLLIQEHIVGSADAHYFGDVGGNNVASAGNDEGLGSDFGRGLGQLDLQVRSALVVHSVLGAGNHDTILAILVGNQDSLSFAIVLNGLCAQILHGRHGFLGGLRGHTGLDIEVDGTGQNAGDVDELVVLNVLFDPFALTDDVADLHGAGGDVQGANHFVVALLQLEGGFGGSGTIGSQGAGNVVVLVFIPGPDFPAFVVAVGAMVMDADGDTAFSGHSGDGAEDQSGNHDHSHYDCKNALFHVFSFQFCKVFDGHPQKTCNFEEKQSRPCSCGAEIRSSLGEKIFSK